MDKQMRFNIDIGFISPLRCSIEVTGQLHALLLSIAQLAEHDHKHGAAPLWRIQKLAEIGSMLADESLGRMEHDLGIAEKKHVPELLRALEGKE